MISTKRTLIKTVIAGMLVPKLAFAFEAKEKNGAFERWRRDFEASLPKRMEAAKVVGASVAIVSRKTAISYHNAFGFADLGNLRKLSADTPMHLASVSKLVCASALVHLFNREGLNLHDNVNDFISFPVSNPQYPDIPITPHQLLTHTSSISDEGYKPLSSEGDPKQSIVSFLKEYLVEGGNSYAPTTSFLDSKPGAVWDYSNVAIALAGHVVESVSKKSFSDYTEEKLFRPLGIRDAHWYLRQFDRDKLAKPYEFLAGKYIELRQEGYPDVPAGMLRCSVKDLSTFLHALLGSHDESRLLMPSKLTSEMLKSQISPKIVAYQGLGWVEEEINGKRFVGHSGRDTGASNIVILTEDQQHAVMVLMNIEPTDETNRLREAIINDLLAGASLLAA